MNIEDLKECKYLVTYKNPNSTELESILAKDEKEMIKIRDKQKSYYGTTATYKLELLNIATL